MKNKTKKTKSPMNYNFGGFLNGISPLLGLINPALGVGAGVAGGMLNSTSNEGTTTRPPQQINKNPYGMAYGGSLNSIGPGTVEVDANNPNKTDSVQLGNIARVDNNETISNTATGAYVFSDSLNIPNTNISFAKADAKIAKSDAAAEKKVNMYNDKESQNTLKANSKLRELFKAMNDNVRETMGRAPTDDAFTAQSTSKSKSYDHIYERKLGGKLPGYVNGGNPGLGKIGNINIMDLIGALGNKITGDLNAAPTGNTIPGTYATDNTPLTNNPLATRGGTTPGKLPMPATAPLFPSFSETNIPSDSIYNIEGRHNAPPITYPDFKGGKERPNIWPGVKNNLPIALQGLEAAINAGTLLRGIEKEPNYVNNSPINLRQFDPSNALMRNQNTFSGVQRDLNNQVGQGVRNANLQQAYSNKMRSDADIIQGTQDRNVAAGNLYDQQRGQRRRENIGYSQYTNQANSQNEAAFFNALRSGVGGSIGNLGRTLASNQENNRNIELLLQAYPDLAKFLDLNLGNKNRKR